MNDINEKETAIQKEPQLKIMESQDQVINEIIRVLLQYEGMSYGYAEKLLYEAGKELRHIHYEKIPTYYQGNDNQQEKHQ